MDGVSLLERFAIERLAVCCEEILSALVFIEIQINRQQVRGSCSVKQRVLLILIERELIERFFERVPHVAL